MDLAIAWIYTSVSQINKKQSSTQRKKAHTKDREDKLVGWILMNRSLGIAVTSWEVIVKARN